MAREGAPQRAAEPGIARQITALEVLKSLVVIPLVVAIVIGIGFGLVRLATWQQERSGKPDAEPAVKGPDGSLTLSMPFAAASGQILYRGGQRPSFSNWKQLGETVSWKIPIDQGRYQVELGCACDEKNAGSEIEIRVDGATVKTTVPNTKGLYETVRAGEIDVSKAGWHTLEIAPIKIAHQSVMMLRGVKLVPAGKG